jgi:hypothetical protein
VNPQDSQPASPQVSRRSLLAGLGGAAASVGLRSLRGPHAALRPARVDEPAQGDSSSVELLLSNYASYAQGSDWGPALQQAGSDLAAGVSSKLVVPPGTYKIESAVAWDFSDATDVVVVEGVGAASVLWPAMSEFSSPAWSIANADAVVLRDLVFRGTEGVTTDALQSLSVSTCGTALFENLHFYGLASEDYPGGAVVETDNSDVLVWKCGFHGCTGSVTQQNPVLWFTSWLGVQIEHVQFNDFGLFQGTEFTTTGAGGGPSTGAWTLIDDPVPDPTTLSAFSGQGTVQIRDYRSDEGATSGIQVSPVSTRIRHVVVEGAEIDGPDSGDTTNVGISVSDTQSVEISDVRFGRTQDSSTVGIALSNCGDVVLSGIETTKYGDGSDPVGYGQIVADSLTNSVLVQRSEEMDTSLVAAATLVVLNGLTPSLQPLATGPTSSRPLPPYVFDGGAFFDLTLKMPVFYVNGGWVDAAGQPA